MCSMVEDITQTSPDAPARTKSLSLATPTFPIKSNSGTVLCVNLGGHNSMKATLPECYASIKALCGQGRQPDAILVQEYGRTYITQFLPGGTDTWGEIWSFKVSGAPMVAYKKAVYERVREPEALLEEFAEIGGHYDLRSQETTGLGRVAEGRYALAALRLKSGASASISSGAPDVFLISYHGRYKDTYEEKDAEYDKFIARVGQMVVKTRAPAIIGGDWNWVAKKRRIHEKGEVKADKNAGYSVEPYGVSAFLPEPSHCVRYKRDHIDYFMIVKPRAPDVNFVNIRCVQAEPHLEHKEKYDHDPIFATYELGPPGAPSTPLTPARTLSRRDCTYCNSGLASARSSVDTPSVSDTGVKRRLSSASNGSSASHLDAEHSLAEKLQLTLEELNAEVARLEAQLSAAKSKQNELQAPLTTDVSGPRNFEQAVEQPNTAVAAAAEDTSYARNAEEIAPMELPSASSNMGAPSVSDADVRRELSPLFSNGSSASYLGAEHSADVETAKLAPLEAELAPAMSENIAPRAATSTDVAGPSSIEQAVESPNNVAEAASAKDAANDPMTADKPAAVRTLLRMVVTYSEVPGANADDYLSFDESLKLQYGEYVYNKEDRKRIREIWARLVHRCYNDRNEPSKLINVGSPQPSLAVSRDAHAGIITQAVQQWQQELVARALAGGPPWAQRPDAAHSVEEDLEEVDRGEQDAGVETGETGAPI